MSYLIENTPLEGNLVLTPKIHEDERGFFFESFNHIKFKTATGLDISFVQDNHSKSDYGVLRGLHFQIENPQGKLVRVTQGAVFDVAVDIRRNSKTFGQWFGLVLSAENKKQMWIPAGFAHGFLVISDTAHFLYKTTDYYCPAYERSIIWNDPTISIEWPLHLINGEPILSPKDKVANSLKDFFK